MEDVVTLIERVGFPVFVAGFVLIKLNGKMDRLTDAIHKLIRSLDRHTDTKDE